MANFKIAEKADEKYDSGRGFNFSWQFIFLALVGQLCWNVENQWFNTFLYRKITQDVNYVTAMVIMSATLTCIATYLFGTISDRKGKRKIFIGLGYIVWGFSTIAVGSTELIAQNHTAAMITLAATLVVVLDGIMSFIGSIAYDSSFNVWVNDHTTEKNKGMIGAVLGIMPVVATILGTVVGGAIIGDQQNYQALFLCMGGFVILGGILTLIFSKDKNDLEPHKDGSFGHQLLNPFRFKNLSKMPNFKEMMLACTVICVYFISFNFYFVHLGNWAIYTLGFNEFQFGLVEGIAMLFGILVALPLSKLINKDKIPLVCIIGLVASYIGLMLIYLFVKDASDVNGEAAFSFKNTLMIISCFFFGTGEILLTEACMIWVRGLFPQENRGQFEGIRCVFFVWLPMLIGTLIGGAIIKATGSQGVDQYGMAVDIPPADLFFWASFVVLATFVPLYFAAKLYNKRIKAKKEALAKGIVDNTLFDAIPDQDTITNAEEVKEKDNIDE